MTDTTVIDATDRFPGDPGYMKRRLGCFSGEELPDNVMDCLSRFQRPYTEEDVRAIYCPEIKLLPFIVMKEGENPCKNPECYWHDEPSGEGHVDYKRGQAYAQLTIKAIERDRPRYRRSAAPIYLRYVFEAMVNDALERRRRGGKKSRTTITSAMSGFLEELSDHICRHIGPSDPVAS
jgi:hypothetical protein